MSELLQTVITEKKTEFTSPDVVGSWERDESGEFVIGGVPLSRAVIMAGGTPCYLYDRDKVRDRAAFLRASFSERVHLHYAIKANPMPALVGSMVGLVDGFDVASGRELVVALDSGMSADRVSIAGPGKSEDDLARSHAADILINIESFREVRILSKLSQQTGRAARVAVRVNLPFELRASGMKMSGGPKQFGIDVENIPKMMDEIQSGGLDFEGFHLFAGSQNLNADAIIEAQQKSYEKAVEWSKMAPKPPRWLNIGGGFGIPYTGYDQELDVKKVIDNVNSLAERLASDIANAYIVLELGRYIVGEAGLYVSKVLDRKVSHGHPFFITDGGMHQHLAASGNFGQIIRKNYPVAVNGYCDAVEKASVVGPLCTPLDILADNAELGIADVDDLIVVFQSGAYGRTASPRDFLSHPDVNEMLI